MFRLVNKIVTHGSGIRWVGRSVVVGTKSPPVIEKQTMQMFSTRKVRPPREPIKITPDASKFLQALVSSGEKVEAIRVGYRQSKKAFRVLLGAGRQRP